LSLFEPDFERRKSLSAKEKAFRRFRRKARFEGKSGQRDTN
jgi:hypothetical protein